MTVKELKEQTEWMPDNYELVIFAVNLIQEESEAGIITIQPNHDERQIIISIAQ
jgi:hypothetical protein